MLGTEDLLVLVLADPVWRLCVCTALIVALLRLVWASGDMPSMGESVLPRSYTNGSYLGLDGATQTERCGESA